MAKVIDFRDGKEVKFDPKKDLMMFGTATKNMMMYLNVMKAYSIRLGEQIVEFGQEMNKLDEQQQRLGIDHISAQFHHLSNQNSPDHQAVIASIINGSIEEVNDPILREILEKEMRSHGMVN